MLANKRCHMECVHCRCFLADIHIHSLRVYSCNGHSTYLEARTHQYLATRKYRKWIFIHKHDGYYIVLGAHTRAHTRCVYSAHMRTTIYKAPDSLSPTKLQMSHSATTNSVTQLQPESTSIKSRENCQFDTRKNSPCLFTPMFISSI